MIDRSITPETTIPSILPAFSFDKRELTNGLVVYSDREEEEFVRVVYYFQCGNLFETEKGIASALSKLLLSGSSKHNAYAIQEKLDFYGAYTDIENSQQNIILTVFCLRHYVGPVLAFLNEILQDIEIPKKELELYIDKSQESLKVNQQKTSFIANRLFMGDLFGEDHPYGRSMNADDYEALTLENINTYYKDYFLYSLQRVIVNTQLTPGQLDVLAMFPRGTTKSLPETSIDKKQAKPIHQHFEGAVQASLFLGMNCVARKDDDYPAWSFLVTLLGGYFGSRLMKNIREDKGYTYGIHSGNHHLPDCSFMSIRSDVKNEVKEACVDEIYYEIGRLKSTHITEDELITIKNYMLGSLQRSFDGCLALGDRFQTLLNQSLPENYYQEYNEKIKSLSIEDIYQTANKYLDQKLIHVVIVGHISD